MHKSIWKYPVRVTDRLIVEMPKGAEILCVQVQRDEPCLWALVTPDTTTEKRFFEMFGTGHPVPSDMGIARQYIGTFQLHGGSLLFHVFERVE